MGDTRGWRQLFDTVFTVTPSSKFSAYINYDYGQNRNYGISSTYYPGREIHSVSGRFSGQVAGNRRSAPLSQPTSKWAFTPRFEVFDDANGFAMFGVDGLRLFEPAATVPIRQTVKEITVTGEYKILEGLLWRAEYRYDWSNQPFFERGGGYRPTASVLRTHRGVPGRFRPAELQEPKHGDDRCSSASSGRSGRDENRERKKGRKIKKRERGKQTGIAGGGAATLEDPQSRGSFFLRVRTAGRIRVNGSEQGLPAIGKGLRFSAA